MARNRLAWGAAVMATCNAAKIGLQLVLTPVMARLLGPDNFGLYNLALPSVIFIMMLADAGLGQSLAREPEDRTEVWSSAFWALLLLGAVLAVGVSAWSIPLSQIAHQQRLPMIMAPLSLCIVLFSITVTPSARLTRRGRIEAFSLIDLVANLVGAAVALALALAGSGVWSLVGQFISLYLVRAAGANLLAFRRPALVFSWRAVAPHTLLGGGIIISKFADSFGRMLESTLVSRRFGSASLGLYAFAGQAAWSLVQAANNPTGTMMYAHAINAPDPQDVAALYRRLVRITAMITLPATAIIAGVAPLLASAILGPAWISGALLIAVIFPSQAIGTLGQLAGAVLYAQGRSASQAWLTAINASLRVAAVVVPFGGWPAVPLYIGAVNLLYFVLGLVNARIQLGWSLGFTLSVVRGPILASIPAAGAAYLLSRLVPANLIGLIGAGAAGGLVYVAALCLMEFDRVREDLSGLIALAWRRRQRVPT